MTQRVQMTAVPFIHIQRIQTKRNNIISGYLYPLRHLCALIVFRACAVFATCLWPALTTEAQSFRVTELPNQAQLPVANVHRIMQDSEGFMWYATEGGGLCRDDGYRIEVFRADKNNPSLIDSNNITCLTETPDGCIWFGTAKGAYILDKKDYRIRRLEADGIKGRHIHCMLAVSDSCVWLSADHTVFRFRKRRVETEQDVLEKDRNNGFHTDRFPITRNGQPCSIINFHEDRQGNLLAVQDGGGILRFDKTKEMFTDMRWMPGFTPNYIAEGKAGSSLWIATWGQGIVRYEPSTPGEKPSLIPQPATIGKDGEGSFRSQVLNVCYDKRHDLLWAVSMDDLYAYRTEGDTLRPYPTDDFLTDGKKILDNLTLDLHGNLWVPGYSPHTFIVHATGSGLRRDSVGAMSEATGYRVMVDRIAREDNRYYWIWQGRTNLSLYDAALGEMAFAERTASPSPIATAKCIEKRRNAPGIWTYSGKRLFSIRHERMEIIWQQAETVTPDKGISTLHDDGNGRLYIGTQDAVCMFDYRKNVFRTIATRTGHVLDMAIATDGTVFFISEGKGLHKLSHSKNGSYEARSVPARSAAQNDFRVIASAPDGSLWLGTSRGNVFRYFPAEDRLTDDEKAGNKNGDAVKNIVAGPSGHVWILTDKYLKEYNPANGTSRLLYSSAPEIDMDYFHTLSLEGDSICLGGIGAFCMIPPSKHLSEKDSSPTVTSWIADGVRHLPGFGEREIRTGYGTKSMEIFVSTFDCLHAGHIQFAWRSAPEDEWNIIPKGKNRIVLDHIPVGTTRLEVKATDPSGCWKDPVVCLTIRRAFPRAATAAFCILPVLCLSGYILWYARKRRKGKRRPASAPVVRPSVEKTGDEPESPSAPSKADEDFLRKATDTVLRNLDNADYSVEQFSSDMCMSRMNMYRKLQALTSQKPSEFVRDIRLKKAAELMLSTELPMNEIIDRVGFGTPRYFSKCFKEKYGMSPSQFRTNRQAGQEQM